MASRLQTLTNYVRKQGGFVAFRDLVQAGFYKALIREALDSGLIVRISRGMYQSAELPDIQDPDLAVVSVLIPSGVICLVSALSFHDMTDEIPQVIDVAIPVKTRARKCQGIPVRYYHFSDKTWGAGIETHDMGGHPIRVYSPAKTIADCFRFRNRIGLDVARSALKYAIRKKRVSHLELMKFASLCRVTRIVKPILETLL